MNKYRETLHSEIVPLPSSELYLIITDSTSEELLAVMAISYIGDNSIPLIFSRIPKGKGEEFLRYFNKTVTEKTGIDYNISINDAQAGTVSIMTEKLNEVSEILDISSILFHEGKNMSLKYLGCRNIIFMAIKSVRKLLKLTAFPFIPFPEADEALGKGSRISDETLIERMKTD